MWVMGLGRVRRRVHVLVLALTEVLVDRSADVLVHVRTPRQSIVVLALRIKVGRGP